MTRYPRQVDRQYLACRSRGLNKIQMIDGGTPDLHQDLVARDRRRRYLAEHQLSTVFQQSDSFHANSPLRLPKRCSTLDRIGEGRVVKPLHDLSVFEEEHACAMPSFDLEASEVVNPLVNDHWPASPGFEYLEALHVIHEARNLLLHGISSLGSFHRFEGAIGAVIREVGHDFSDIVRRPSFAEILDYLDVGFFLSRRLSPLQR